MPMAHNVTPLFSDPGLHSDDDAGWLTGDAVIRRTGISKATLIQYVRQGVIDRSMLRFRDDPGTDGRRQGYFSSAVIARINELQNTAEADARQTASSVDDPGRPDTAGSAPPQAAPPDAGRSSRAVPRPPRQKTTAHYFHLRADRIDTTTLLVNRELQIGWFNGAGNDGLSAAIAGELADNPAGTVFDIMLRASLKELVFDWQPLFTFIYRFLRENTPAETFDRRAPMIHTIPRPAAATRDVGDDEATERLTVDSCALRVTDDRGRTREMRLYGIAVAEGALFVLAPDHPLHVPDGLDAAGREAGRKTPFSVLSARIDDSRNIVDTLLPETYFQLMTRIWDETDRIVESFGGQRAKRSGTEVQYILVRQTDRDPAFDAICCAIRLRDRIRAIEAQLKADGGWFADIRLNIGISSGSDHLQSEDLAGSMAFMLPGGAADQAFHLSTIAHGGTILITKSAFGHLTSAQMDRITFGIYRDDRLIPNIFAKVSELPHAPDTPPLEREIRALFVTRIIDLAAEDGDPVLDHN